MLDLKRQVDLERAEQPGSMLGGTIAAMVDAVLDRGGMTETLRITVRRVQNGAHEVNVRADVPRDRTRR